MTNETTAFRRRASFLYTASRSRRFLWLMPLALLAIGGAAGLVGSLFQPSGPWLLGQRVAALGGGRIGDLDDIYAEMAEIPDSADADRISQQVTAALAAQLRAPGIDFLHVLLAVPRFAYMIKPAQHEAVRSLLKARFEESSAELLFNYLVALGTRDPAATDRLRAMADAQPPVAWSRYVLGQVEYARHHYLDAFERFHAEGEQPQASAARAEALRSLIKAKDYQRLVRLRDEPAYRPLFTPNVSLEIAIGRHDWREILRRSPEVQLQTFERRILIMTLLVGAAWAFFFLHLAECPKVWSTLPLLCLAGLVLGVVSTVPTVWAVIIQDDILHLEPGHEVIRTLLYFVGGVGFREEICKLLLFLPLVPFLLRRDDDFEALMVASFVGLGFAIEENGGYYVMSELANAPGRFLTANFFHAALTGLNGLALYRACRYGARGLNEFCSIVPLTIVAHGLYDAGLSLPQLDDTGTIAMAVYVFAAWFYFGRVHELRNNVRTTISLTGAYVFAISIVAATMLAFQMMNLGPAAGFGIVASEIIGSAIVVYMFLREFREPLAE